MKQIFTKVWFEAAGIRAIKTFAQTFVSIVGTTAILSEVDWKVVISSAILSTILSFMTSLAGLPELTEDRLK